MERPSFEKQPREEKVTRSSKSKILGLGAALSLAGCAEIRPNIPEPEDPREIVLEAEQVTTTSPENSRELPKGAFGFDSSGVPFGWDLRNYEYFKSEPSLPDLTEFLGRSSTDEIIKVKLREEAFNSFQLLMVEADNELKKIPGLKNRNLEISSGFRTFAEQAELRKKYEEKRGPYAELPGRSEHHLGTAVDIKSAKVESVYKWLMGDPRSLRDPNYVPPMIRYGFVPTVSSEPWHYRYVGKSEADAFWIKYRDNITGKEGHLRHLAPDKKEKRK
jgi:hypothetical protein